MNVKYRCLSCGSEWERETERCPECSTTNWAACNKPDSRRATASQAVVGRRREHALKLLGAGIEKANKRTIGEFDGLHGSLPDGTSIMLREICDFLRTYLLDDRAFSEARVRALLTKSLPPIVPKKLSKKRKTFRSVPRELEDEGVRVAIGVLNSIASVLRVKDDQIKSSGQPLAADDATSFLLSGTDGLRGAKVRRGGSHRATDTRDARRYRHAEMQKQIDEISMSHPKWSFRECARHVASKFECSERTVRRNTTNPRK